ncbi:hypothetical protein CHGG_08734 [Chaetomium globosum CBS 148.51]|uniref:NADP-dependent oxidoreductase domain-containing protein n=1 Tax=Chaetomium globosum (strain ATCC 6205 / CBS 148.51 / DSM 1962 / NBRC 6347 / NRRL 1970) TaxID=306901 RepID=Q2GTH0_CHAGB|nr:uncharacterized protein CHGG_08734 [Chaetomium globosum CBS 148.51]EAQ84720.1 hypothetical protein CHGG_08734 [Chaetomium globosum CBS 148.51]
MAEPRNPSRPPLHTVLPPLVLGTATFNTQYVSDPHSMPYRDIVARALSLGVNAFDTSPYYGPSETLLGTALNDLMNPTTTTTPPTVPLPRSSFFLITKAGRLASTSFDYSPSWTAGEVLAAVRELRRLRDEEGVVRYVGISGFPVDTLCALAEMVRAETGEPLDAVLSYGHFTVQNRALGLPWVGGEEVVQGGDGRRRRVGEDQTRAVDVVLNASILGMGLLTSRGIPADPPSDKTDSLLVHWHPSPPELRIACKKLAELSAAAGERLESVAIRWAIAEWARIAAAAGLGVDIAAPGVGPQKVGVTVCGVTTIGELEETVAEWRGVLASLALGGSDEVYGPARQEKVLSLVRNELWPALQSWLDYTWDSPGAGFVNTRPEADRGITPDDGIVAAFEKAKQDTQSTASTR